MTMYFDPQGSEFSMDAKGAVFIDGHRIRGVVSVNTDADGHDPVTVTLVIRPSSTIYGRPSAEAIKDLYEESVSEGGPTVDISKAIQRAEERRQHP